MDPKTPSFIQDSSKKQGESVKSQKEIIWKQKIAEINEITDRLGKKIDEKIKKTVVAFLHINSIQLVLARVILLKMKKKNTVCLIHGLKFMLPCQKNGRKAREKKRNNWKKFCL